MSQKTRCSRARFVRFVEVAGAAGTRLKTESRNRATPALGPRGTRIVPLGSGLARFGAGSAARVEQQEAPAGIACRTLRVEASPEDGPGVVVAHVAAGLAAVVPTDRDDASRGMQFVSGRHKALLSSPGRSVDRALAGDLR